MAILSVDKTQIGPPNSRTIVDRARARCRSDGVRNVFASDFRNVFARVVSSGTAVDYASVTRTFLSFVMSFVSPNEITPYPATLPPKSCLLLPVRRETIPPHHHGPAHVPRYVGYHYSHTKISMRCRSNNR